MHQREGEEKEEERKEKRKCLRVHIPQLHLYPPSKSHPFVPPRGLNGGIRELVPTILPICTPLDPSLANILIPRGYSSSNSTVCLSPERISPPTTQENMPLITKPTIDHQQISSYSLVAAELLSLLSSLHQLLNYECC